MTPMMQQYQDAKAQHPGMLLLFRNGDFYELFEDDAELGSRVLGLTLTKRDKAHPDGRASRSPSSNTTSAMLLQAGHRVAVCEQMEEPRPEEEDHPPRGEPRRHARHGDRGRAARPAAAEPPRRGRAGEGRHVRPGLGRLVDRAASRAADVPAARLADELARLNAGRVPVRRERPRRRDAGRRAAPAAEPRPPGPTGRSTRRPRSTALQDALPGRHARRVRVRRRASRAWSPPGPSLIYLQETLKASLAHIRRLQPHRPDTLLTLDEVTRRSLELTRTLRDDQRDGSLLSVLDRTVTPMGARLLHDSAARPAHRPRRDRRPARRRRGVAERPRAPRRSCASCSKRAPTSSG